jgi:hypothetical protein
VGCSAWTGSLGLWFRWGFGGMSFFSFSFIHGIFLGNIVSVATLYLLIDLCEHALSFFAIPFSLP